MSIGFLLLYLLPAIPCFVAYIILLSEGDVIRVCHLLMALLLSVTPLLNIIAILFAIVYKFEIYLEYLIEKFSGFLNKPIFGKEKE